MNWISAYFLFGIAAALLGRFGFAGAAACAGLLSLIALLVVAYRESKS